MANTYYKYYAALPLQLFRCSAPYIVLLNLLLQILCGSAAWLMEQWYSIKMVLKILRWYITWSDTGINVFKVQRTVIFVEKSLEWLGKVQRTEI